MAAARGIVRVGGRLGVWALGWLVLSVPLVHGVSGKKTLEPSMAAQSLALPGQRCFLPEPPRPNDTLINIEENTPTPRAK
ncbi:hypothetical protein CWI84_03615 [Idiomarina tyrosinivorans]|uniref:Uncharacterized protein n=1 Tax=Idiomarina tyrosinivorans TaxID=1445662 RepID=A0A432ZRY3_9GAMM|nr:hypothetical protein CWI84_03615 [Idiomarina tyrosinivorans]